jgi:RNA polymerase sigma-70 factor (family 1)
LNRGINYFIIFHKTAALDAYQSYSDLELFSVISRGDESAFSVLYYRYVALLHPYILSLVKSEALAEEIVQVTMMRVWMNRDKLEEITQPKAWIFRIAANDCYNYFRRKLVEEKAIIRLISQKEQEQESSGEFIRFREIKNAIQDAVERLSPQRKLVYRLSREEGLKNHEIAEKLNLAEPTVKKTLQVALEQIRAELIRNGYTISLICFFIKYF